MSGLQLNPYLAQPVKKSKENLKVIYNKGDQICVSLGQYVSSNLPIIHSTYMIALIRIVH